MASAAQTAHEFPEKSLFRIGEVSRLTDTKTFVLRFWESEFPTLQPVKSPSGHRLYRREDIETVLRIKRLLYDEGFTIAGARKHLSQSGEDAPAVEQTAGLEQSTVVQQRGPCAHQQVLLDLREELCAALTLLKSE
jgi:DNA-binding transcriptional MerR regulator